MYLIVGLGNPEEEYANTRHNMGFNVINKIAEKYNIDMTKEKFQGIYGSGQIEGEKVVLLKPQTYMNLSGNSIREFINFYKIPLENLIVIYDDVDIEPGLIRIRKQGNAGTHNGMKSVVHELGTTSFARIRVGIGKPKYQNDMINHVLQKMTEDEKKTTNKGIELAYMAVVETLKNNIDIAMNKYNKIENDNDNKKENKIEE